MAGDVSRSEADAARLLQNPAIAGSVPQRDERPTPV